MNKMIFNSSELACILSTTVKYLYQYLCELYKHCFNISPLVQDVYWFCFHTIEITDTTFFNNIRFYVKRLLSNCTLRYLNSKECRVCIMQQQVNLKLEKQFMKNRNNKSPWGAGKKQTFGSIKDIENRCKDRAVSQSRELDIHRQTLETEEKTMYKLHPGFIQSAVCLLPAIL